MIPPDTEFPIYTLAALVALTILVVALFALASSGAFAAW